MPERVRPIPDIIADKEVRRIEIDDFLDARAGRSWFRRFLTWPVAFLLRLERQRLAQEVADLRRRYRGGRKT